MFARTKRLTLRPAWPEDAAAIAAAIGHEPVLRMLARAPLPYTLADAESFAMRPRDAEDPAFVIVAHDRDAPALVGGIGIHHEEDGAQLGYWIAPEAWGRGYATEAGHAVIAIARHALPVRRLAAWHFTDNPASARVLAKLGFRATGEVVAKSSGGREGEAPCIAYALDLEEDRTMPLPIAADLSPSPRPEAEPGLFFREARSSEAPGRARRDEEGGNYAATALVSTAAS